VGDPGTFVALLPGTAGVVPPAGRGVAPVAPVVGVAPVVVVAPTLGDAVVPPRAHEVLPDTGLATTIMPIASVAIAPNIILEYRRLFTCSILFLPVA
jgi:hypothetical protein